MEQPKKKCMMCGKDSAHNGAICMPCQERVRREALGDQAGARIEADRELKKHGIAPSAGKKKN